MSIANFCIKHKVTTLLAVIMVALFGVVFTTQLQMSLLPNMEYPAAVVVCYYNGASPSDMEELVTRPMETAILSVAGVEQVISTSADSMTQIQVMYVADTNVDIAATKLREKFDALNLPDGVMSPVIVNLNISDMMPTAMIALAGEDLATLQALAENTVGPALERIDGVASVDIYGGVAQKIAVEVNATRAAGFGLSNGYIAQLLTAENLLFPGGAMENGSKTLTVSTDAKFHSIDDVANLILPLPTGGSVRLSEVAQVRLESPAPETMGKVDGAPCVILQVLKRSGANEASTADDVAQTMAQLREKNSSVVYSVPYSASKYINLSVEAALQNIIMGVVLAAVVVFFFLRRIGATMTIAVSMPVCILTVFTLMNVFDLTLNMMSLGGIAMGVGMIVDNSIVVLENIYRYAGDGHSRLDSCVEGTREVTTSVVASTLTTVVVFLPLGLSGGLAGMLFKDFCLTIAFLILSSMAIALTLVPLMCYMLLDEERVQRYNQRRADKRSTTKENPVMKLYTRLLAYFVHHLWAGMLVSLGLIVLFVGACLSTKMVLMPEMDQGMVTVSITTPIGSEVEETAAIADQVIAITQKTVPELNDLYYMAQPETASLMINLVERGQRQRSSQEVGNALRQELGDIAGCEISVTVSDMSAMMGTSSDISVEISGTDYATLAMVADDLADEIAKLADAVDVTTSLSKQVPQVKVTMNREAAAQHGLTAATVGAAVRAELTGTTATTLTINNKELDVVVRGSGEASASLDALRAMAIATPYGGYIPLSAVANVNVELSPQSITRVDQARQVTITGATISGDTTAITNAIKGILSQYSMPEGYTAQITGSYADMMDSFGDLLLALVVALGLVYFILASQFESFLMPVIIMMILPIAFSGALFALPVMGRDLSMISLVALIMLAGTVVNASIILVDYIKKRRDRGESRQEAILHACPLRIRPVLMTTLTTILALIPMALGLGETNEMITDMGITMISGMVISTIITLLFTPVYYSVIDNFAGLFRRKKKPLAAEAPTATV